MVVLIPIHPVQEYWNMNEHLKRDISVTEISGIVECYCAFFEIRPVFRNGGLGVELVIYSEDGEKD